MIDDRIMIPIANSRVKGRVQLLNTQKKLFNTFEKLYNTFHYTTNFLIKMLKKNFTTHFLIITLICVLKSEKITL